MENETAMPRPSPRHGWKRPMIRCLVVLFLVGCVIDGLPHEWKWGAIPKACVDPIWQRLGLWQGQWSMFTPHPVLNNGWTEVEWVDTDQNRHVWSSPDWKAASGWEKFYRFRHVNYFNRLDGRPAADEGLLDYIVREESKGQPVTRAQLFQYRRILLRDWEAPLPTMAESTWGGGYKFLFQKEYLE